MATYLINNTGSATSALQTTLNNIILAGLMPAGTTTNYITSSAGANLKSTGGTIYSLIFSNLNSSSTRYFQLFNQTTSPTTGNVPVLQLPIPVGSTIGFGQDIFGGTGFPLSTGVTWGVSTTAGTYTAAATSDSTLSIRWS